MNCRGIGKRTEIINDYYIKPIAHVKLLNGQQKKSCTGDLLTDRYYCFSFKHKKNNKQGSFFCGIHAANNFLELLNLDPLPLFDPLKDFGVNSSSTSNSSNQYNKWHPVAEELYNAINLLIICWNTTVQGFLGEIKDTIVRYPHYEPYLSKIKAVNTILSKDSKSRTLQDMISDLKKNNPDIRSFTFNNINKMLNNNEIKSYFG